MSRPVFWENTVMRKEKIETIQINVGNLRNGACGRCHGRYLSMHTTEAS